MRFQKFFQHRAADGNVARPCCFSKYSQSTADSLRVKHVNYHLFRFQAIDAPELAILIVFFADLDRADHDWPKFARTDSLMFTLTQSFILGIGPSLRKAQRAIKNLCVF